MHGRRSVIDMSIADKESPEGLDPDRTLIHSVYCANCGFNLRYATYVGRCNECGESYNARALFMKGIFIPAAVRFPMGDILVTLLCCVISFSIFRGALRPANPWAIFLAVMVGLIAGTYAFLAVRRLSRFLRAARILRRIRAEEE